MKVGLKLLYMNGADAYCLSDTFYKSRPQKYLWPILYSLKLCYNHKIKSSEVVKMGKKPNTESIDAEDLRNIFIELRQGEYGRFASYQDIMSSIGYNDELDTPIIDAFLIKAVKKKFGTFNTEADIILMDLGLLEGYDYNVEITITSRRAKYLQESKYLIHDNIPYSDATKSTQRKYQKRLEENEDKLLLRLAAYLNNLKDIEKFLNDIGNYMVNGVANLPTPSYIKRKGLHDRVITAVIKYLLLGKEIFMVKDEKTINRNNECEITVNLTKYIIRAASAALCIILPFFMLGYIQNYRLLKTQQNYSYVTTDGMAKQDYATPLAKQKELPDADVDDSISISDGLSLVQFQER